MTYKIKEVIKQTGLSEKAIRLYISKGLISPKQEAGPHRTSYFFTEAEIDELNNIALLRGFGFSIQDIKDIQTDESNRIHSVLLKNSNELKQKQELINMWNVCPIDMDKITDKETLLTALQNNYKLAQKDKLFSCTFPDDCDTEPELCSSSSRHIRSKNLLLIATSLVFLFTIGLLSGIHISKNGTTAYNSSNVYNEAANNTTSDTFSYGIVTQELEIKNVVWSDFPGFRKVSLTLSGELKLILPDNAHITLIGCDNPSDDTVGITETSREDMVHSDGNDLIYYDIVTYVFSDVAINSEGILKNSDYFNGAMDGYEIVIKCNDMTFSLGYILPLDNSLTTFTTEEYNSFSYNLKYHSAIYTLSSTYLQELPLTSQPMAEDIYIERIDDEIFHYRIINNSNSPWEYKADLADIEMYYRGVWLKITSPYDSALIISKCAANASVECLYDVDTADNYPYFIPGVYRLVVYGVDGTYIASECFVID